MASTTKFPPSNDARCLSKLASLPLALALCSTSLAQTAPDAGSLQQQIERQRQPALPGRQPPDQPAGPQTLRALPGPTVTVTGFRLAGNQLIRTEQLSPLLAGFLNRPLDLSELRAAAVAVGNAYREAGWIVRVFLPVQDVSSGVVTIQVIEGVFGSARLEGTAPQRISSDQVIGVTTARLKRGEPIRTQDLDRGILLADDLPGVGVRARLTEGEADRETAIVLNTRDKPWVSGDVSTDNAGTRSTGAVRLLANMALNSPLGLGDQALVNSLKARGIEFVRVAYNLPVGLDGWRVGLNASELNYRLTGSNFDPNRDKGRSSSLGVDLSYPLIRGRQANLFASIAYDQRAFDNQFAGATSSRYQIDSATLSLFGNLFDTVGGGGANNASLALSSGSRRNQVGTTNQQFSKLRYSLARQQALAPALTLVGQLSGQESRHSLDSSEKFYLGGAFGVRAYPTSEGGGDSGTLATLELRWALLSNLSASVFHDRGYVRNLASRSYGLQGSGVSLNWQPTVGLNLRATLARRNGSNPNPAANGSDQDGSLERTRFWLSINLAL